MLDKIICLIVIAFLTLIFGFFPKIFSSSIKGSHNKLLGLANAFSGGIFMGIAFFHLLPEGSEAFASYFETRPDIGNIRNYPFQFVCAFLAYALILFIEKIAFDSHSLIDHDHKHDHSHNKEDSRRPSTELALNKNKNYINETIDEKDENKESFTNEKTKSKTINASKDPEKHDHSHNHNHDDHDHDHAHAHAHAHAHNHDIHDHDHDKAESVKEKYLFNYKRNFSEDLYGHPNSLDEPFLSYHTPQIKRKFQDEKILLNLEYECLDDAFKQDVIKAIDNDDNQKRDLLGEYGDSDQEEEVIKYVIGNKGKYMAFMQMRTLKSKRILNLKSESNC